MFSGPEEYDVDMSGVTIILTQDSTNPAVQALTDEGESSLLYLGNPFCQLIHSPKFLSA
jgi:hypothetical protein